MSIPLTFGSEFVYSDDSELVYKNVDRNQFLAYGVRARHFMKRGLEGVELARRVKPVRTPVLSLRAPADMAFDIAREAKRRKTSTSRELKRRLEFYAAHAAKSDETTALTA